MNSTLSRTALEREIRKLRLQVRIVAAAGCAFLLLSALAPEDEHFEEINVERINVVEKDGRLVMVLSNQARQHPGIMDGKVVERDYPRPPGLLFFDQHGDEMGGLVFGENGEQGHFGSLTFDKVRNDQALGVRYLESDDGSYTSGIEMWHQPDIPGQKMIQQLKDARAIPDAAERQAALDDLRSRNELTTQRLFLGKGRDDASRLELCDIQGRPRVRILVGASGEPRMEFTRRGRSSWPCPSGWCGGPATVRHSSPERPACASPAYAGWNRSEGVVALHREFGDFGGTLAHGWRAPGPTNLVQRAGREHAAAAEGSGGAIPPA